MADENKLVKRLLLLGIGLSIALTAMNPFLSSADGARLEVSNIEPEFVANDPSAKENFLEIEAVVSGTTEGELRVEFVDYIASGDGKTALPGGSVPYSLARALTFVISETSAPNRKIRSFKVRFSPVEKLAPRIFSGGIRVSFSGAGSLQGNSSNSTLGAELNLTVTPFGVTDFLPEGSARAPEIVGHQIRSQDFDSWIDGLLPDIPGVVNSGPILSELTVRNPGEYPVFYKVRWEFEEGGALVAVNQTRKELLLPGDVKTLLFSAVTVDPLTGREINVLPAVGVIDFNIDVEGELGGNRFPVPELSGFFIILPWKFPALLVAILVLILWVGLKAYRRSRYQALHARQVPLEG